MCYDESVITEIRHPTRQAEEPPLRPLKPSEALRIGAALRPQCAGAPFLRGRSCAIGAIYEGMTGKTSDSLELVYDYVRMCLPEGNLLDAIWARNDGVRHGTIADYQGSAWTREEIADWLAEQGL